MGCLKRACGAKFRKPCLDKKGFKKVTHKCWDINPSRVRNSIFTGSHFLVTSCFLLHHNNPRKFQCREMTAIVLSACSVFRGQLGIHHSALHHSALPVSQPYISSTFLLHLLSFLHTDHTETLSSVKTVRQKRPVVITDVFFLLIYSVS